MNKSLSAQALLLALASALVPASAGCHKATFVDPAYPKAQSVEGWNDFFLFGLVGDNDIDVREVCGGEAASVRTGGNVGTDVVSIVTLGIYTPRKVYVTCANPQSMPSESAMGAAGESTVARVSAKEVAR